MVLAHWIIQRPACVKVFDACMNALRRRLIGKWQPIVTLAPLCYEYPDNMQKAAVNLERMALHSSSIDFASPA
jgi:hypothetical protein